MKTVIAGGSGALGSRLAADLAGRGYEVVVLTRSPKANAPHRQAQWDGATVGPWAAELSGAGLVNLAGEVVDRRPTKRNIQLLTDSRVRSTRALVAASQQHEVAVWVQGSTLAIYGDAGEAELSEDVPVTSELPQMTGVAKPWEEAFEGALAGSKTVLRTSIALATGTPALDKLVTLAKFGLGGRVGSGQQWFSWIHIADWLSVVRFALAGSVQGVVNATAPNPVRNAEFMAELRGALRRPWAPPTPALAVRLGAPFLGTDAALALTGRRGIPRRLLDAGFEFQFPTLAGALDDLLAEASPHLPAGSE